MRVATRRDRAPRGRRGFALLTVVAMSILTLLAWEIAYRAMQDSIRTESFFVEREHRDSTVTHALALGAGLLRTGTPPDDPYACVMDVPDGAGQRSCTLTFTSLSASTWQVDSRPSTASDLANLPLAPDHFN